MEEKELIRRIRNSFKVKKTRAEILSGFQKRGYKLAYADELIRKAKRPKMVISILAVSLLLFFSITFSAYTILANPEKMEIKNPLAGLVIVGEEISEPSLTEENNVTTKKIINTGSRENETTYEDIEITPEFISFLLNEVGAWKLHKNPLTLENPIINFKIENEEFYSEIGTEIQTFEGESVDPDLLFNVNKEDLVDSILEENSQEIFVKSIQDGRTTVDIIASEPELFAKGYLEIYNTFSSE